ncbi:MAG: hypothetical protein ACRD3W_28455, partial [Terriglobales bacterium]
NMPVMDGLEATRRIRAAEREQRQPRVAIVAVTGASDRESCIEAGADDFFPIPLSMDDMRLILDRWIVSNAALTAAKQQDSAEEQLKARVAQAAKNSSTSTETAVQKSSTSTQEAAKKSSTSTQEAGKKSSTSTQEAAKKSSTSTPDEGKNSAASEQETTKRASDKTPDQDGLWSCDESECDDAPDLSDDQ